MMSKCPYCGSKDITDIIIDAPIDFESLGMSRPSATTRFVGIVGGT